MSSSSSPTRSLKDPDSMKSPDRMEKKIIPIDQKLENRLNMKDLEKLQDAFMTQGEGYDNRLSLNKAQFCEALSILLKKGSKQEYADLFDKIDVTQEGTVDWDKFASHMLLEFYEKDDRVKSTQVPQWKDLKALPSPHKEVVQRVRFLKNTNRYVAISKEGCVSMWGTDLKLQRSLKTGTDSCKARDLWVTDFVPLQNVNKIALAFTSKEIAIYDLSSKLEFNCQYKVQGLPYTPLCLDYWSNPNNVNEAILVWGDVGGYINIIFFTSANIALFERPPAPAGEKQVWQEPCLNVPISEILIGKYKNSTFTKYAGHREESKVEWVREVLYSQYLECFISCSTSTNHAVVIGWMEKHTAVNQSINVTRGAVSTKKEIQRQSEFVIVQGVNSFDYNEQLNLIATAGVNNHVCLWNPYVVSKPNGVLRGHMASVVQVQFIKSRGQLISFSKDKVLRIWDVQLQVCIQRLAGMFPKGPEVQSKLYFDDGKERSGVDRNRLFITFNYQLTALDMKVEIKDRIMSHEKPIVTALYNTVYNQVISVCQAGTIVMWMIDTGQKVKQFNSSHGTAEVTCLSQDLSETRLFTGSTDGTVKVWDFNGHCYHTLSCSGGHPADVGQILILKRQVLVVGWAKYITVFRNNNFRDFHVEPADWKGGQEHVEDILCVAFVSPNILASGAYDGEIVVWNTNSEQASRHLSQRSRKVLKSRTKSTIVIKESGPPASSIPEDQESKPPDDSSIVTKPRPKSRALSRVSEGSNDEQNEFGLAISKLLFLETRKTNSSGHCANLVSCGGNGWVRFWNTSKSQLMAEYVAHLHAGSIIMATDKKNQYLVTGDVDGVIKVWEILEYCMHHVDDTIQTPPPLKRQFHPHQDMINSIDICERNDRMLVISSSSDCSVAVWDIYGNKIGVFGQDEHWRIEQYIPGEELQNLDEENETADTKDATICLTPEKDEMKESTDIMDEQSVDYRINTWDNTVLGKDYQELRIRKRERRQPGTIPNLPYLHWERTGQAPAGPYSALQTSELLQVEPLVKPDAEKYFLDRPPSTEYLPKLPVLADTLKTAFDEKSLFPKFILDYELLRSGKGKTARGSVHHVGSGQVAGSQKTYQFSPRKNKTVTGSKLKPVAGRKNSVTAQE
ncbi:WD repeat-containing protein 49-like [Gigantopelta aegis]|uniref:WD repeat-containing protein 49-like n=1 Tax=Gigantopelta aegis TaxID=1735272 RepID=UPI001B88B726|nr:WD repeat-containing protein 49-like [Gigantopelta aegis]